MRIKDVAISSEDRILHKLLECDQIIASHSLKRYFFLLFQNLKNQIMTTNLWVEQVRPFFSFSVLKCSSNVDANQHLKG